MTTATQPFPLVLCLAFSNGLPLHVAGVISATTSQRFDVVDHVALTASRSRASSRAWVLPLKLGCSAMAACNARFCGHVNQRQRHGDKQRDPHKLPSFCQQWTTKIPPFKAPLPGPPLADRSLPWHLNPNARTLQQKIFKFQYQISCRASDAPQP